MCLSVSKRGILFDGPLRLEDFNKIKNIPSEMYKDASVLSSALLFLGGNYCFIDGKAGAKVLEKGHVMFSLRQLLQNWALPWILK